MKDLIWDNALSVQIQEIDDDHRKLVELLNILSHAIENEEASNYIEALIEELISLTIWHFRHEERLMLKYAYDALSEHKAEHQDLIDSVKGLQKKFMQNKTLGSEDIEFLEYWLTGHILSTDMEMSAYLCEVM